MKEEVVVSFNLANSRVPDEVFRRELGIAALARAPRSPTGFYSVTLPSSDPQLIRLRAGLREAGVHPLERLDRKFTLEEAASSPMVWLAVERAPRGEGGPSCGTQFDLSDACRECGTGAKQVSDLVVRTGDAPRSGGCWTTLSGEVIVSRSFAAEWSEVPGLELRTVQSVSGRKLPWTQLLATVDFPRLAAESRGVRRDRGCAVCERDGWVHSAKHPTELRYRDLEVGAAGLTWERFGRSSVRETLRLSYFAPPLLLVPGAILTRVLAQWPKGLLATPVEVA